MYLLVLIVETIYNMFIYYRFTNSINTTPPASKRLQSRSRSTSPWRSRSRSPYRRDRSPINRKWSTESKERSRSPVNRNKSDAKFKRSPRSRQRSLSRSPSNHRNYSSRSPGGSGSGYKREYRTYDNRSKY